MKNRNYFLKCMLGIMVTMLVVIMMSVTAFAEDCVKTVKNTCEAKAVVKEFQATGVNCNLTIKATRQDLITYLKGEFEKIPMTTNYRPVQFELVNEASTTCPPGNNSGNTSTCAPGDTNCSTSTCAPGDTNCGTSTCAPGDTNCSTSTCAPGDTNCSTSTCAPGDTNCSKKSSSDSSENGSSENCNKDNGNMDNSPKTADGSNLKFALCVGVFALVVMISMLQLKKRRS